MRVFRSALILAAVVLFLAFPVHGLAGNADIPIPTTMGWLFWWNGNELVKLEKTRIQNRVDTSEGVKRSILGSLTGGWSNLVGKEKATDSSMIQGARSPARVPRRRPILITKTMNVAFDPQMQLIPVQSVREHREVVAFQITEKIGQTDVAHNPAAIELEMSAHDRNPAVLIFTPVKDLEPGEYAVYSALDATSKTVHGFGVEPGARAGSGVEMAPAARTDESTSAESDKANPFSAWKKSTGALVASKARNGTPDEVLLAFIEAQEAGDIERTASLIVKPARAEFRKNAVAMSRKQLASAGKQFRDADYRLETSTPGTATFCSSSSKSHLVMILEDNCWRVDPRKSEEE